MISAAKFTDMSYIAGLEAQCIECAWTQRMHEDAFNTDGYKYLVFKTKEGISGYIIIRIILDEAEVCNLAVAKEARRNGIAQKLLDTAHGYCLERSCTSIFLEVNAANIPAIALYEKNGYVKIALRKDYYQSGDALIMRKVLKI